MKDNKIEEVNVPFIKQSEIENILKENVYGQVCDCGGGGTDDNNDICETCNGLGIYEWEYGLASKKIYELITEQREFTSKQLLDGINAGMDKIIDEMKLPIPNPFGTVIRIERFNRLFDEARAKLKWLIKSKY